MYNVTSITLRCSTIDIWNIQIWYRLANAYIQIAYITIVHIPLHTHMHIRISMHTHIHIRMHVLIIHTYTYNIYT